jgi:hypothetical protein
MYVATVPLGAFAPSGTLASLSVKWPVITATSTGWFELTLSPEVCVTAVLRRLLTQTALLGVGSPVLSALLSTATYGNGGIVFGKTTAPLATPALLAASINPTNVIPATACPRTLKSVVLLGRIAVVRRR